MSTQKKKNETPEVAPAKQQVQAQEHETFVESKDLSEEEPVAKAQQEPDQQQAEEQAPEKTSKKNKIDVDTDKNANIIENFYKNFKEEFKKEPTIPFAGITDQIIKQFEKFHVNLSELDQNGLKDLFNGRATPVIGMRVFVDDLLVETTGRIALYRNTDGGYKVKPFPKRNLELIEYQGHKFTNEERIQLQETGNLGKPIQVFREGETVEVLLSLDKEIGNLNSIRTDKVKLPTEFCGIALDSTQQAILKAGEPLIIRNMVGRNGDDFSEMVQYNAFKRGLEFVKDSMPHIPNIVRGVALSRSERTALNNGEQIFVEGLEVYGDKTRTYNAHLQYGAKEGGKQGIIITPEKKFEQKQAAEDLKQTIKKTTAQENKQTVIKKKSKKVGI